MSEWFDLREVLSWLTEQDPGLGFLLIGGGLIFVVYGWRLFRFMIALSLAVMGGVVAGCLGPDQGIASLTVPVLGAIVAGWIGVRAPRAAVALATGGWAAALMLGSMARIDASSGATVVVAAITFAAAAALACAAVRPAMAFVTSVEGTILIVVGALVLLSGYSSWWSTVRDAVESNPIFLPFALIAGTVTGYYVQLADMQEKDTGLAVS